MRMSQGVEWAIHTCLSLAWSGEAPVPAARLAEFRELPPAYLTKHLQQLARAGIVRSVPGPRGGFVLARPATEISYLDVVEAIEGGLDAFRCAELRQRGPMPATPEECTAPCQVAAVMHRAEAAWRTQLAKVTLASTARSVARQHPQVPQNTRTWLQANR